MEQPTPEAGARQKHWTELPNTMHLVGPANAAARAEARMFA
jgi:hypothetical protein